MIVLTVQSFNGQPTAALSATFDELGGTVGRADNNQLVLPDPDRSISRVHAQVVFRHGAFALVDRGSNPVLVNGTPLGNGREAPLKQGDTLQIGGYLIGVSLGQHTTAKDLFADLFGDAGAKAPAAPPRPPPPLFTQSFGPTPVAAPPAPAAGAASVIPDDWDPFAPSPAPASVATPFGAQPPVAGGSSPYIPDLPLQAPSAGNSLDALFNLGGSGADPFAGSPLAAPLAGPNTAADADPLRALGLQATPVAPSASDHVSDLNTPWMAPPLREAVPPAPAMAPPVVPAPAPLPPPALPPGAVLSWDQPSRETKVVTLPGVRRVPPPEPPAPSPAPAPTLEAGWMAEADPRTMIRPPSAPRAAAVGTTPAPAPDELLAALAEGLGLPAAELRGLDADQLRRVGALLRESTRGAVELLVARAAIKREMRADVTLMAARENNPLKFSPNVEVALKHLLGAPTPGFMGPTEAMRDAFDDLRAHQLGVMAGMRAALEGVLQRFDPAVLEAKISKRSGLAGLLPSGRKAQLWEQFQQLYSQLSAEAADDFQELFGKAFRKAYEAHIDQLQQDE
ncbi:type VI secretion system-associated FHA domain protein TagH [Aquincola tertiaricarbonis]|uniref:type VI secretion system-associated FHA domain protein TagH n=1 Tax=Aquincola tertiaricarbonis TaxID=391953 RepID=UPI000614C9A0|nr:type VI secretion system-associated FHA domain protein TagH [Aquincola tertiaricarbonis]